MPASVVGEIGLAISIVNNGCTVLKFIIKSIKDFKQFGNDLRQIQTRTITEIARLQALTDFLQQGNSNNGPRFAQFPILLRRAIIGLIQELDILFSAYWKLIDKYNLNELEGFEYEWSTEDEMEIIGFSENVENLGIAESEARQQRASFLEVSAWGLFRKKNVEKVVAAVTSWNDRLMNLMICGLCFGTDSFSMNIDQQPERTTLENLQCRTGLVIRKLVLEDSAEDPDILQRNWRLQAPVPPVSPSDLSVQQLTKKDEAGSITTELVYVEYKPFEIRQGNPSSSVMRRVCHLATLLRQPKAAENGFRTLRCSGVVQQTYPRKRFAFVYELPSPGSLPVSLSEAIDFKTTARPTLHEKFQIASAIAETVFQFHSVNWLHKSIRSEHILFFYDGRPRLDFCKPHLVGFEFSRDVNDRSTTETDDSLACNIYRHPDRWGPPDSEERFGALHDIYALGVVLLEIGIWRHVLGFDKHFDTMDRGEVKKCLEVHAKDRLPHYMGVEYTRAVLTCLGGKLVKEGQATEKVVESGHQSITEDLQIAFWENVVENVRHLI